MNSGKWGRRSTRRAGAVIGAVALATPLSVGMATAAETGTIAVCLTDSTGAYIVPLDNQAWIQRGSISYVGGVGASDCRETTIPAGTTATVWVGKEGTHSDRRAVQAVAGETTRVTFRTTKVTVQYPGAVAFGGSTGDSRWFKSTAATATRELLSDGVNPTVFRLSTPEGYVRTPVQWPVATKLGRTKNVSLVALQVLANDGTPLSGATATYQTSTTGGHIVATDERGLSAAAVPGLVSDVKVTASVNRTTQVQSIDASTAPIARFQTTRLNLHYPGEVRYFYSDKAAWFSGSMELFAGTYPFDFRTTGTTANPRTAYTRTDITVPEPATGPVTKSAAVVRLQDSTGAGLSGAVSYYLGGWRTAGTTDSESGYDNRPGDALTPGSSVVLFDGKPTNVTFAVTYEEGYQQLSRQNIQTHPVARFHTVDMTLRLVDHAGDPLEGSATFFTKSWRPFGTTVGGVVNREVLPVKHTFTMSHLGSQQQVTVANAGATPELRFQTGRMVSESGAAVSYYTNGWRPMPSDGLELLPSTAYFRFGDGTAQLTARAVPGEVTTIH